MAGTGRPGRAPGGAKVGGRKVGSLDKAARQIITEEMGAHILACYQKLGGLKFLIEWASQPQNQTTFITTVLARLMPAMPRDGADAAITNQTMNIDMNDPAVRRDMAVKVAYLLSAGLQTAEEPDLSQIAYESCRVPEPVQSRYSPPEREPAPATPVAQPDYDEWAASVRQTEAQKRAAAEVHGSSAEQGVPTSRSGVSTPPRGRTPRR